MISRVTRLQSKSESFSLKTACLFHNDHVLEKSKIIVFTASTVIHSRNIGTVPIFPHSFSRDEDERDGRLADRLNDLDDRRPGGGPGGDGPGDRRPGDGPLGNRDPPRRDGGDGERPERPERVWTFALTVDNPPFAFM